VGWLAEFDTLVWVVPVCGVGGVDTRPLVDYPSDDPDVEVLQFDLYTLPSEALDELNAMLRHPLTK
jgi:hypothetical protein